MLTVDAAGNGAEASELDQKANEAKNVLNTVTDLGQAIFRKVNDTVQGRSTQSCFVQSHAYLRTHLARASVCVADYPHAQVSVLICPRHDRK
jgi:hypothetical protein